MEKKRFKMYKKGKNWLIAPIVFLGILGAVGIGIDKNAVYADETPSKLFQKNRSAQRPMRLKLMSQIKQRRQILKKLKLIQIE